MKKALADAPIAVYKRRGVQKEQSVLVLLSNGMDCLLMLARNIILITCHNKISNHSEDKIQKILTKYFTIGKVKVFSGKLIEDALYSTKG
jgi:hypothetical protein